eukprot:TRINITY_DN24685_c3_g2_i1.p1 TRINITY_DN24685_c3_g2~~TRINITY_DN24685_c3_g2_i1.p1  ORF type:complete len:229 (+),score=2.78 TRINITY_DN24685_c3_g2_i1:77-763(+)
MELKQLDDLCYISTNYLVNIQSVKLRFTKTNLNNALIKKMVITENLTIRGLTTKKNQQVGRLEIHGDKHDVYISNSKFDGLQVSTINNTNVELSRVKFTNSSLDGFSGSDCTSIIAQDIFVKNCRHGFDIHGCQSVVVSNIIVQQCVISGCNIYNVQSFEITNAKIFKCMSWGILFFRSKGKVRDVVVRECSRHGVCSRDSQVRYHQFLCDDNGGGGVYLRNGFIQEF